MKNVMIPALLAIIVSMAFYIGRKAETPLVYVNNHKILAEYDGFKEARTEANRRVEIWRAELDSMKIDYSRTLRGMEGNEISIDDRRILEIKGNRIGDFEAEVVKKIAETENDLTGKVVAQIDNYIKDYGSESGYKMIFGVTESGNLLYSQEALDITEEVLVYLNQKYQGK